MKLILLTSLLAIASGANFMKGLCMKGACGDGKCHPGPEQNFSPTFWCSCPPYRRGDFCDVECSVNCSLTETCVLSPTGLERCQAKDSFIYGAQAKDQGSQCPDVCQNGGYCKDGNCVCPIGFNGTTCSEDIDECQLGKQCFNGNCINTYGSFKCECFENFAGRLCAWSGDDYEEEAELMDLVANTKVCTTLPQCVNSGACEKRFDGMEYCVCPNGYTGELCELDIDECQESPCQNGGTCSNNNGSFQCFCVNGFKGDNCEINIDDCIGNNCSAGSTCEDGIGRYTCRCPPGLTGHYCEKPNPCDAAPCQNGGQCTLNEDGGFSCSCSTGYKGILCSQDVDECEEGIAHCYHGGECVNTPGSYNCECRRGYNGSMCENAFNTCEAEKISCGSGECVMTSQREPVCQCKQGFFGARCDVQCPEGLGGYNCDISINEQMCGRGAEKQCENHGICSQKKCICQPDFVGDHCEIARKDAKIKNACMVNVCLNNGACLAGSDGESDVCLCEKTFTGITCEIPVDPCKNSPCYNGGHCLSDQQSRTARCICEEGFEGEFCEKKTQVDCSKMVCKNGGECEVVDGQSTCFCPTGFAGPTCEKLVPVNKFLTLDDALRDKCVERNCSARAGNGVCDEDCNHFVCDYDGGDCSATQRPFKKCMYEELCAHSFGNGKCDQVCNNVECLLDGLDCMPEVSTCPIYIRNHCSKRFADSICNEECNTEACGFDGGDCLVTIKPGDNVTTNVISDIRLTLMVSPETFVQNAPRFLMDVSRAVRMPVRIQTDSEGPLIFELIDDEVGERILVELRPINNTYKEASSRRIQKRQVAHRVGVVAWLEVDEQQSSNCHRTSSCLFSDAQSIVDFVSADIARQGKTDYFGGMPIAEAVVSPRTTTSTGFKWPNTLLMTAIGFVMIAMLIAAVIVSGEEKRNRKRRFVSAPVWMPPTEKQAEEMKRCSQSYNHYFDVKRGRFDIENGNAYTQLKSGYGNSINNNKSPVSTAYPTYAQVRSNEPTSRLLLEAAGQKRITVGSVTSETVNERDSKHRRSALHWLADNSSKKTEEDIYADAELLLKEGAEVNVLDNENETPLMLAVRARRTGLVKLFMKHGADPTIFNNSERTTLHVAVNNYDEKTLEVLLRYPSVVAEIDEIDHQGRTPLMEAARISAEVSLAQLLINHGAKIECDGNSRKESEKYKGRTALHYAAMNQNFDMVQYLVKLNANKDKQDEEGQTPLMLAALAGDARIVEFLIGEGASVDTTDQMDRNARQLAESVFHYAVVHVIDEAIKESRFINAHFSPDDTRKVPKSMAAGGKAKHTIKTMKKTVPRKGSATPQSVSADSAYNLTPPPSDGSITPPSYLPLSANTTSGSGSSSSGYHPISSPQYQGMTSLHYSNTSSSTNGDSSPDYKPQDPGPMLSGMQWSSSGYGMNHYTINQTTPNNVYSTQSVFGHDYKPYQNHQQYPEEAFNMTAPIKLLTAVIWTAALTIHIRQRRKM